MIKLPNPVSGSGASASWLNRAREAVRAMRLIAGPGIRLEERSDGTVIQVDLGGGGGQSKPATLQSFVITALTGANYFTARTWDGTLVGGTDIYIAKPKELWLFPPNSDGSGPYEIIDGVQFHYSQGLPPTPMPAGWKDNNRTSNDGTNVEQQVMTPRYVPYLGTDVTVTNHFNPSGFIWAMQVNGTTDVVHGTSPVTWIEVTPARHWVRRFVQ